MAIYRKIHVQFWGDVFIQSLTPEQKFFFLYLLTNERTKQCGIYEITTRQISFDTGYTVETVLRLTEFFTDSGKIRFSRETNEIAIKNWDRYNSSDSPSVKNLVNKELASVKNRVLVEWVQSVDTVLPHNKKEGGVTQAPAITQAIAPTLTPTHSVEMWDSVKKRFEQDFRFKEKVCGEKKLQQAELESHMVDFLKDIELKEDYKNIPGLKKHFVNWLNKRLNGSTINRGNSPGGNSGTKLGTSDARTEALRKW